MYFENCSPQLVGSDHRTTPQFLHALSPNHDPQNILQIQPIICTAIVGNSNMRKKQFAVNNVNCPVRLPTKILLITLIDHKKE